MEKIAKLFGDIGGQFFTSVDEMAVKIAKVKAFVFDWDGVFNDGSKHTSFGSTFSEVDSMGCNLLRFSHYLGHGRLPVTAIISGEKNDTAIYFAERECFNFSFYKIPHKLEAFRYFCMDCGLEPYEVAYVFDDVLDVPIAELCGIRIAVNQHANPLFLDYCQAKGIIDYLTAFRGGNFAVREAVELMMGLTGNFREVVDGRKNNSIQYQDYVKQRRQVKTECYTMVDNAIGRKDISVLKPS